MLNETARRGALASTNGAHFGHDSGRDKMKARKIALGLLAALAREAFYRAVQKAVDDEVAGRSQVEADR
jgi:hypothetical protein